MNCSSVLTPYVRAQGVLVFRERYVGSYRTVRTVSQRERRCVGSVFVGGYGVYVCVCMCVCGSLYLTVPDTFSFSRRAL